MPDKEKVIKGLEICIDRVPGKYTCNECPYEIDGNFCEINLAKDALSLVKKQEDEIENLKQTAQSMMEGIVISTPMFHPCESCQEFNCDFCKFKRTCS